MTILWLILKIILWILVGLISIFCLLLLGILFLPIIYEMEGEKWDTLRGKIKLNIFYILKVDCDLSTPENIEIKLLGFKVKFNSSINNEEKELKNTKENRLDTKIIQKNEFKEPSPVSNCSKHSKRVKQTIQTEDMKQKSSKNNEQMDRVDKKSHTTNKQIRQKKSDSIKKDIGSNKKTQSNKEQKSSVDKSKGSFKEFIEEIKELWYLDERAPFFRACKKLLISWWRALKPYYLYFEVIFGLEDPSETGLWLAKLMVLYPFYAPYGKVIGNFEEQVLQGYIRIKGKTRLIKFLYPTLVFIAHKEVRTIIRKLMNFGKDDQDGIKT